MAKKQLYISKFLTMFNSARYYTVQHELKNNQNFEFEIRASQIKADFIKKIACFFFDRTVQGYMMRQIDIIFGMEPSELAKKNCLVFDVHNIRKQIIDPELSFIYTAFLEMKIKSR